MTDVMQKVWQNVTAGAAEQDAPAPPDGTGARGAPAAAGSPAAPGAFDPLRAALEPAAREAPALAVDDLTAPWEPRRVDADVVAFHRRPSSACEAYRSLRAQLTATNPDGAHRLIAITSSLPQEGRTVTAVNLALVMAAGGRHRVLLVEADLRRPAIARKLSLDAQACPGLADVLRGKASASDALRPTPRSNLKLILAGQTEHDDDAEAFDGAAARATLSAMRRAFDYVIFDTPALAVAADACMLAPHCDGTLLVIRMDRTPEPTVQAALHALRTSRAALLGCVLARCRGNGARGR